MSRFGFAREDGGASINRDVMSSRDRIKLFAMNENISVFELLNDFPEISDSIPLLRCTAANIISVSVRIRRS
jgi:hypothetical protein